MSSFRIFQIISSNKRVYLTRLSPLHNVYSFLHQFRHVDVIKEFTGCCAGKVMKAMSCKLELQYIQKNELIYKLNLLKGMELYDFKTLNILPLLSQYPSSLKNKHASLYEYGFSSHLICAFHLKRFNHICKQSVKTLKEKGFIEKNVDVLKALWECAELDTEKCPEVSEDENLHSLKALALKAYFIEKLGASVNEVRKLMPKINSRLLNKSFKNININFSIFQDTIKLSKQRIFSNWYILSVDSDNTSQILSKFPSIGSTDMKLCLNIHPKIVTMPVDNIENMINYFNEYDVPIIALEKFPILLTLNCETVKERLKEIHSNKLFNVYHKHPNVAKLLYYQVKAKKRLKILQDLNVVSRMNHLVTDEKIFERICQFGSKGTGHDSVYYLKAEFNLNKEDLMKKLKRHKRWSYVPVVEVAKNLNYLRKSFSDKDISNNIYALFYYHNKLFERVENFAIQEEIKLFKNDGLLKKQFILPLIIYFLEKETNFTGESVWDNSHTNPYQDLPDASENKANPS